MAAIDRLFEKMLALKASDLHLLESQPPKVRQHGHVVALEGEPPLTKAVITSMLEEICPRRRWKIFLRSGDADFAYAMGEEARFRANYYKGVTGIGAVFRIIPVKILTLDMLKAPEIFKEFVSYKMGLVLVTGPTGSGKTTTLYSALSEINTVDKKIITNEDPVEYDIDGLIQVPINPEVNMTYAKALRAILRQDPDVIFVGEIRDIETGGIAVEAALTGHLVLSTLHTNDAPSVVTRLVDLGIEPFLLSAVLEGVIAQRLVRKICQECKVQYTPEVEELMEIGLKPDMVAGRQFFYGQGCKKCNTTGYKGRQAIFEMFLGTPAVKEMIAANAKLNDLRRQARKDGMRVLREAGITAVYEGRTTIEEIVRETVLH